jgi:hypothetical protein
MMEHARTTASEVHALLLEAHPEADNVNQAKAAHLAESAGEPRNRMELFVAFGIFERSSKTARVLSNWSHYYCMRSTLPSNG